MKHPTGQAPGGAKKSPVKKTAPSLRKSDPGAPGRNPKSEIPSPGHLAYLACLAEVLAPKAGNVHPGAPFDDAGWEAFAVSAMAIAPLLDRAADAGVGPTILACVRATRATVGTNTNLGMVLLLAPLCAVPRGASLAAGVKRVLAGLTRRDDRAVYEAIRLASPGGLGQAGKADVRRPPPIGLVEAMALAADRDAVARQFASNFADVLDQVAPALIAASRRLPLDQAIVRVHLQLMAAEPDSLIRRKCGDPIAAESARRAAAVLAADWPATPRSRRLFTQLDRWLRADGRRRNPGTSADLIAAGLFAAMREGKLLPPWRWSGGWQEH